MESGIIKYESQCTHRKKVWREISVWLTPNRCSGVKEEKEEAKWWTFHGVNPFVSSIACLRCVWTWWILHDWPHNVSDFTSGHLEKEKWAKGSRVTVVERERERERRSSLEKGWEGEEGTGSSDREGRFYYVILLMHSVLGDPRASNVPRKNIMFLRSENRPWKNPFMPFHLHSTEFHLYILRCKSQTKPFNPLTLKLSIFLFSFYNLSLLCRDILKW